MTKYLLGFVAVVGIAALPSSATADSTESVLKALSGYDSAVTVEGLEKLAGSQDALVASLLVLRHKEDGSVPPYVSVRAERLLLQFAGREDVQAALEEDLQSEQWFGLARIVVVHLDTVSDAAARSRLAKAALDRAAREQRFTTYGRMLRDSSDPEVSRMAREALE